MTTYRSAAEFGTRFEPTPELVAGEFRFPVERYLEARGRDYSATADPNGFLCLSESIDLHAIEPADVRIPATLIAVTEDQLIPLADMRALADGFGAECCLRQIDSVCGHDAFLTEGPKIAPLIENALGDQR